MPEYWDQVGRNARRLGRQIPLVEMFIPDEDPTARVKSPAEAALEARGLLYANRPEEYYRKFAQDMYQQQIGPASQQMAAAYARRGLGNSGLSAGAQQQTALGVRNYADRQAQQQQMLESQMASMLLGPVASRDESERERQLRQMLAEREAGYGLTGDILMNYFAPGSGSGNALRPSSGTARYNMGASYGEPGYRPYRDPNVLPY